MQSGKTPDNDLDVAIIGGGISALGIARALAGQQVKVAVFDKASFCNATSANSLRIIHGGFRYLQSLNLPRALRSIQDQHFIRTGFAEYVSDFPCVLPLVPGTLRTKVPLVLASLFYTACYGVLTGNISIRGRVHTNNAGKIFEGLPGYATRGLFVWDDVIMEDPAGLVDSIVQALLEDKVDLVPNSELVAGCRQGSSWNLEFKVRGENRSVSASRVINATGPWVQEVGQRLGQERVFGSVLWARAVNLVLNRLFEPNYGVAFDGNQGALYFMTPRAGKSVVGTFYKLWTKGPDDVSVSERETAVMVAALNRSLTILKLQQEEVAAMDVGLLPVRKVVDGKPVLHGSDQLEIRDGAFHVLSTKYTTFKSQGERVAKAVLATL